MRGYDIRVKISKSEALDILYRILALEKDNSETMEGLKSKLLEYKLNLISERENKNKMNAKRRMKYADNKKINVKK